MLSRLIPIFIILLIVFLVDLYVFQAVRTITQNFLPRNQRLVHTFYWAFFALTIFTVLLFSYTRGTPPTPFRIYLVSLVFIIFASKLVVVLFLLADDAIRLMKFIVNYIFSTAPNIPKSDKITITRNEFLSKLGLVVASIPFVAFIYGMIWGAYNYRVKKITLKFPNLPQPFDGFKIIQISDLHTGSFSSTAPLKKAVPIINKQAADLVFFTGDLVNNIATEVVPHMPALGQIKAPHGVLSILGNHDYGDYVNWENREAKINNLNRLKQAHGQMGWRLLLNENVTIEKNGERFAVLGVENWSTRLNFPKYGNLDKAYTGTQNIPFKILLSHDPSHWDGEINNKYADIDLTLSGHTHGMQFGVNIPGFKWSPVQYVYKQWAGLYKRGQQFLYVNTGLGFLGYPGRVGFLPEITLFTLKRN